MNTLQELNPSDYQAALDEMPEDAYLHLSATAAWIYGKHSVIKSALTRCAAEPVDAGELDALIAGYDGCEECDFPFDSDKWKFLQIAKAHRASLTTTQAKGE